MKRILIILITVFCVTALFAQTKGKKTTTRKTTRTTKVDKKTQLRNEQASTQKKRKQQQQEALRLNKSIRSSLDSVLILDHNISEVKLVIDTLNHDIDTLNTRVSVLNRQVDSLKAELADKKSNYAKALVYLHRHKTVQQKLMFIFSASSLQQAVRRARYVREYSAFQRAQGEIIKEKQRQVRELQNQLLESKARLESKRSSVASHQRKLETARLDQKKKVDFLNKNLANVQSQIKALQKRELALNAEIDRIIREEAEAARRKAEAERKRREEAARKAEEARRAEAEAARRIEELRQAEASVAQKAQTARQVSAQYQTSQQPYMHAVPNVQYGTQPVMQTQYGQQSGQMLRQYPYDTE
jgi:septal ring factor EnvC (AmiA/AmiB activator)